VLVEEGVDHLVDLLPAHAVPAALDHVDLDIDTGLLERVV
jgi:hypothetical protein